MINQISTFLTLAAFLISQPLAAAATRMTCVTEFPTTSVFMESEGEETVVNVIHHHGFKYMPLHSGIITPSDLQTMAQKAALFEKLGDRYEFRWNSSDCTKVGENIIQCYSGKPTSINGTEVKPFSVYTKATHSQSHAGTFNSLEVSFLIDIEGSSQHFSMSYDASECAFGDKAKSLK